MGEHTEPAKLAETELRVMALHTVLAQKGYIDPAALDVLIETFEAKIGPRNGARVVARAWCDADFRKGLLLDASNAIASLGYKSPGIRIIAVEKKCPSAPQLGCVHTL